jgi:hypothetical protein
LNEAGKGLLDSSGIRDGTKFNQNLPHIIALAGLYSHYLPQDYSVSTTLPIASTVDVSGTYKKDVVNVGMGVSVEFRY